METCLYHDDKLQFDLVCKDIQRAKFLPRSIVHRLAMAVCACRRDRKDKVDKVNDVKLQDASEYAKTTILERPDLPCNLRGFLEKILWRNISCTDYSYSKFLTILYDSVAKSDHSLLTLDAINSKPIQPVPEKAKTTRMTKQQFLLMARRKFKNKERTQRAALPLFAGNVLKLKNDSEYQTLWDEYGKSVFTQFCEKENTEHMNKGVKITEMDVYSNTGSKEPPNAFIFALNKLAKKVQAREDTAYQKRKMESKERKRARAYFANARERYDQFSMSNYALDVKEDQAKEYSKGQKGRNDVNAKATTRSALDGGHCLQCLSPFIGLSSPRGESNLCIHHPGFIKSMSNITQGKRDTKHIWSCCGEESSLSQPTHQEHVTSGCEQGIHNWRPNKKQYQKASVSRKTLNVKSLIKTGLSNSSDDVIKDEYNY